MTHHPDDDEPRTLSTESSADTIDDSTSKASAQPDDDPGLPTSGVWLAILLRGDTPLMRCGF